MAVRLCIVSFTDHEGVSHSVEVHAESLYEAVALAVNTFKQHDCTPGQASQLQIEVKSPSVTHTVTMRKVQDWLNGACKSPNEKVVKERLKALLS